MNSAEDVGLAGGARILVRTFPRTRGTTATESRQEGRARPVYSRPNWYPNYPETAMTTRRELLAAFAGTNARLLRHRRGADNRAENQRRDTRSFQAIYVDGLGWKPVFVPNPALQLIWDVTCTRCPSTLLPVGRLSQVRYFRVAHPVPGRLLLTADPPFRWVRHFVEAI
jgi:hypothetical protein